MGNINKTKDVFSARFLQGNFGEWILKEYEKKSKDYKLNNSRNVLSGMDYNMNMVWGCNSFKAVLMNEILQENELRIATVADVAKIEKYDILDLEGRIVNEHDDIREGLQDLALVLRSEKSPEPYLAKNLAEKLRKINPKMKFPTMINLADLKLEKDQNSNYGLAFSPMENANIIYAPILNSADKEYDFKDVDDETGLPKKVKKYSSFGDVRLDVWKPFSGLSSVCRVLGPPISSLGTNFSLTHSGSYERFIVIPKH